MSNIIFFGSDRYSAVVLTTLLSTDLRLYGYTDLLIITDQPKPKGKQGLLGPNEVEIIANNQKLKVLYYQSNIDELINYINQTKSIGLSASFPHLFPPSVINAFGGKLFNLHPSLLPQYRNVAPGPYAIAMGDKETGITLQLIDEKIDHGSIIAQQTEPILPTDTTTTLLNRLFTKGADMFIQQITSTELSRPTDLPNRRIADQLIFTRKLKRESGYIDWGVVNKLLQGQALKASETDNPLINLRLTHHPERTDNILTDLIRGLDTYERVWTTVPQAKLKRTGEKGELQLTLSLSPHGEIMVLIPGKPKPIPWVNLVQYYLSK